jgi:hypothetical protein
MASTSEAAPARAPVSWIPFVASAALAALGIQLALRAPLPAPSAFGALALLVCLRSYWRGRRVERLLLSGTSIRCSVPGAMRSTTSPIAKTMAR